MSLGPLFAQNSVLTPTTTKIESYSTFPGGADKFYQYIKNNLQYPIDAKKDSLSGVVYVEFTLGKDGIVVPSSVRVTQSLSVSCDAEAVRLIRAAPRWLPAKANGIAVEQLVSFPVQFSITGEQ
jgi:TonB family protein